MCIWITLLCCSLVCGGQAFDWWNATAEVCDKAHAAERNQDIPSMMDTYSDNAMFYVPHLPPTGKTAMSKLFELRLKSGEWSNRDDVKIRKFIAECNTVAAAEIRGDEVMPDGTVFKGSGIMVLIREEDVVKFVAFTWSSDVPLNDKSDC